MLMRKENQIRNISTGSSWEQGVSNYWGNVLFRRCLQTKSFRDELDTAVKREYNYMNANRINGMVSHYESITNQYLWKTPDSTYEPLTRAQYDVVAGQLHDEIEQNYKTYRESYDKPMPFFIGTPQSRQWQAQNQLGHLVRLPRRGSELRHHRGQGLSMQGRRL